MKKGRTGYVFSVLCNFNKIDKIEKIFFLETPTIGVRKYPVNRTELHRQIEKVSTSFGIINIKKSYYKNKLVNIKPEHDDIVDISKNNNIPVKELVYKIKQEIMHIIK